MLGSEHWQEELEFTYVPPTPSFEIQRVTLFCEFILKYGISQIHLEVGLTLSRAWVRWHPEIPSDLNYSSPVGTGWRDIAQHCLVSNGLWLKRLEVTFLSCLFPQTMNPYGILLSGTILTNRLVDTWEDWGLPQFLLLEVPWERDNWMLAP